MTRRVFLKSGALALVGLGVAPRFLVRAALAKAPAPRGKVLVAIFQRGAADGLNVVVPHAEAAYYAARPTIAIQRPQRGNPDTAFDLDGLFGLHPSLEPLKALYDRGTLAIVHAVGSPDNTRSHFDAQDFMETATPGVKSTPDGWLNRHLQVAGKKKVSPFRAVAMGPILPRSLRGEAPALALANLKDFEVKGGPIGLDVAGGFEAMYEQGVRDLLNGTGRETFEAVKMLKSANPARYEPANGATYPRGPFGDGLRQIAQLIKADLGLEIGFVDTGGWDHHAGEGNERGQLANRLLEFGQGIAALAADLGDRMADVVILTMSEFGRTVRENGNRGTDHGHANAMFIVGGPVRGGKVYGRWPGLAPDRLYEGRDLALTTDFRDVFGEVLTAHLGSPDLRAVFPGYPVTPANFRRFLA